MYWYCIKYMEMLEQDTVRALQLLRKHILYLIRAVICTWYIPGMRFDKKKCKALAVCSRVDFTHRAHIYATP